jgi:prevent-host-death family protein
MIQVGMHEAKTRLSELVKLAAQGEKVCLTNRGKVVAEIVTPKRKRKQDTDEILRKFRKLVKEHPLGTFEEVMKWRREGLR